MARHSRPASPASRHIARSTIPAARHFSTREGGACSSRNLATESSKMTMSSSLRKSARSTFKTGIAVLPERELPGNLLLGARSDGLLARLGKGNGAWALSLPDVTPMISRGRTMVGWVRAGPIAYGDDAIRLRLIEAALAFVRGLPPKGEWS